MEEVAYKEKGVLPLKGIILNLFQDWVTSNKLPVPTQITYGPFLTRCSISASSFHNCHSLVFAIILQKLLEDHFRV